MAHVKLVQHLYERGHSLMLEWHSDIIKGGSNDSERLKLGFHNPKCTSIDHLHMHMMVGKRRWKAWWQFNRFTYTSITDLRRKMDRGTGKL